MMQRALVAVLVSCAGGTATAQGIPVFDASATAQMVLSVRSLADQLRQLQAQYDAVTGSRGLGALFNNPELKQFIPEDWRGVYNATASGGYSGITGAVREIRAAEQAIGTVAEIQSTLDERSHRTSAIDKVIGLKAFEGARLRLAQIEALLGYINQTRDPKSVQELQARIAAEQAAVANENTKLQLAGMLQRAEEKLIDQQKSDAARKILSSGNRGMPACCSSRAGFSTR